MPPALDWLYQPADGGMDSVARAYRGFDRTHQPRLLRPARPLRLELKTADLLTLTCIDGATRVLLVPVNNTGDSDFAALGLADNPQQTINLSARGYADLAQWYASQGGRPDNRTALSAVSIFDTETKAGERFTLRATADTVLWLLIDPAQVYDSDRVFDGGMGGAVTIEHVRNGAAASTLPDPFGEVRDEFTIPRGTARAYELKAGETVQIIDVDGQQCSDFMAMNAQALDGGLERYIDSTATRSMIRGAYPIPGLFDKFYDQDMRPLLKLKQDTVGRHDTFALACTARGYEERGFFGHLNCSDNISHAYKPWSIAARSAWPAINFFFNSWIDHRDNRIQSDEAWSRPGDYVAMEAMTDLVAVSTACPDDVDPINGWNPTDIHV